MLTCFGRQTILLTLCVLALLCAGLVDCAPLENTCTPGNKGSCACPDGTNGERTCQDDHRMGPCFCRGLPQESSPQESSPQETTLTDSTDAAHQDPQPTEATSDKTVTVDTPASRDAPTTDSTHQETSADQAIVDDATSDTGQGPKDAGNPNDQVTPECNQPDACQSACTQRCTGGSSCVGGKCTCSQGLQFCANYCADLEYDPFHCGACNKTCTVDQACLSRKCQCFFSKLIDTFDLGCAFIRSIHFGMSGKMLAAINDNGNSCGSDLRIWDAKTRKLIHEFKAVTYRPVQVLLSQDDDTVMVRGGGRRFYRFSIAQKKSINYIDVQSPSGITSATVDPDTSPTNTRFAAGTSEPALCIIEGATRKNLQYIKGLPGTPTALAYRPDAKHLAVALSNKEVWVYETQAWKVVHKLQGLSDEPTALAYAKSGAFLAVAQQDSKIVIWEPVTGKTRRTIVFQGTFVYTIYQVAVSADEKYVISAWADRTAKIHDVATGRLVHEIGQHRNEVRAMSISTDGKIIATGAGTSVRLWGCVP